MMELTIPTSEAHNNSRDLLINWSELGLDGTNLTLQPGVMDVGQLLLDILGAKRKEFRSVVILLIVYSVIFLTGIVGNVCTCIVIARNAYMRNVTNYYLFSLAVSDILTLVFALPPELYSVWEAYPWHFGEAFCIFKSFLNETTSYTSVLTITSFTVERYIAICHPIRGQRTSRQSRAVKCIVVIWLFSACCALPYPIHTRVYTFVHDPRDQRPICESVVCNIPFQWQQRMSYMFQISTFVFFVIPMAIITGMYLLIGMRLRSSAMSAASQLSQQYQPAKTAASRARRAVLKMLVAVVIAFFVCWAPFHAQRLMTLYVARDQWTPELLLAQSHLFYISGVLYFLSCTVNPILYNLLSRKFRQAFRRTLCRCCFNIEPYRIPAFYRLKAKFVGKERPAGVRHSDSRYLYPDNVMRLAIFTEHEGRKGHRLIPCVYGHPSTNETSCKNSSPTLAAPVGAHAHSDGRLHRICRHKNCSSRRTDLGFSCSPSGSNVPDVEAMPKTRTVASYSDILCHSRALFTHKSVVFNDCAQDNEHLSYAGVSW